MFHGFSLARPVAAAFALACAFGLVVAPRARAQDSTVVCLTPDTIVVRGTVRTSAVDVFAHTGLVRGQKLTGYLDVQRAIQGIFAMGEYEGGTQVSCDYTADGRHVLAFTVRERPTLAGVRDR